MLAKGALANFASGVSQQAAALRLPTQSAAETNTFPVIVDGNKKRPPTELIGPMTAAGTSVPADAYATFIERDTDEKYILSIYGSQVHVHDLAGNEKVVNNASVVGWQYLDPLGADQRTSYDCVTVADHTFITNRNRPTVVSVEREAPRLYEALINVAAGNYGKTYRVWLDGNIVASYTTPNGTDASDQYYVDTSYIAASLANWMRGFNEANGAQFTSGGASIGVGPAAHGGVITGTGAVSTAFGWDVTRIGNAIWVRNLTGADFNISVEDGLNHNAMRAVKGTTQRFTDLPIVGPDGFVAKIEGDSGTPEAAYYVKAVAASATGDVVWKECRQLNIEYTLDANWMPHILVREADGTFTFKEADWAPAVCGDMTTCPMPSFAGKPIMGISLYKNRLVFHAGDNVVASRAGDFFNFFRSSAVTLLDTDPIDVNAATPRVANIRSAIPYQETLTLWTDLEQLVFSGADLLTPKTAAIKPSSAYENLSASVKPVASPRRVFFATKRGDHVGIREWYSDVYYHINTADENTAHVPTFIPSGVYKMALNTTDDILAVGTNGDTSALYVHKFYWSGQDKLQSAWVRWEFPGATVVNFDFINGDLYLLMVRGAQMWLEKVRTSPNLDDGPGVPVTYLDRRVVSGTGTYDVATDVTTYTLPYAPESSRFKAVSRTQGGVNRFVDWPATVSGTSVALRGDTTAYSFYFGELYEMRYRFSPQYVRQPSGNGQGSVIQEGRLQLLKMDIVYENAGYFRVEVTPPGREPYRYEFFDWQIGDAVGDVDISVPRSGIFTVPVMSKSDDVIIEIVNDSFLPASFIRAEWKGNFVPKSRK